MLFRSSEVSMVIEAHEKLTAEGIKSRVVSVPSWEIFEQYCAKNPNYRNEVLPCDVRARVAVEMASTFGWERFVGLDGAIIGMKTFGASAPFKALQKKFGFSVENVVNTAKDQIRKNKKA